MYVWYKSKKGIYPRHIIMRKRKPEIQGKKLWREKKKKKNPCSLKRSLIPLNFSSVTAADRVQWLLFELRGSTSQSRILYLVRVSLNNETNIISFKQQKSLLGVCCERSTLEDIWKDVFSFLKNLFLLYVPDWRHTVARGGRQMPWEQSCRQLWQFSRVLDPNPDP